MQHQLAPFNRELTEFSTSGFDSSGNQRGVFVTFSSSLPESDMVSDGGSDALLVRVSLARIEDRFVGEDVAVTFGLVLVSEARLFERSGASDIAY
jgi:hypothetical protein